MCYTERVMNMKKQMRKSVLALLSAAVLLTAAGCSAESKKAVDYLDGTYSGRSSDFQEDENGNGSGYGAVSLEIKDNRIVSCTFQMYELDGTLKDENYGAGLTKENRLKAQKAVQSAKKYAAAVVKAGAVDQVDAISGATISYHEFKEAVNDALKKAEKTA